MTNKTNQGREICKHCKTGLEFHRVTFGDCCPIMSEFGQRISWHPINRFEPIPQQPPQEPEGKDLREVVILQSALTFIRRYIPSHGTHAEEAISKYDAAQEAIDQLKQEFAKAKRDGEAAINSLNEASKMAMELERTKQARIEELEREVAKLQQAPLCGNHAEVWYCARPIIETSSGCVWCDLESRAEENEKRLADAEAKYESTFNAKISYTCCFFCGETIALRSLPADERRKLVGEHALVCRDHPANNVISDLQSKLADAVKALEEIHKMTMPSNVGGAGMAYSIAMKVNLIAHRFLESLKSLKGEGK